jgi:hypothetical protein
VLQPLPGVAPEARRGAADPLRLLSALSMGSKRSGVSVICLLLVSISYSLCPPTRMRGSIIP